MNTLTRFLPVTLAGSIAVLALAGISGVGAETDADPPAAKPRTDGDHEGTTRYIPGRMTWQRDIAQFDAELRKLAATAKVPEEEPLKKRLESRTGEVEVITDGYGGVVDFNAAKGTVQHQVNEKFGGMLIDWEFELLNDTKIHWDDSTDLVPMIARTATDGEEDSRQPIFDISVEKAAAGPFRTGDRVRLKAAIDDFSRFRKNYRRATGLVAIYYLEESPNPVFSLILDEAEVTLIQRADQDAGKTEPAEPDGAPEEGVGEDGRNELEPLQQEAGFAYSRDKKLLALLGQDRVQIWSLEKRRQVHQFLLEGRPLAVAFSPDGERVVTADGEGNLEYRSTIKLWTFATGEGRVIANVLGSPTHLSFSPDGSRLAASSKLNFIGSVAGHAEGGNPEDRMQKGGCILVWRLSDGRELLKVDIELPDYSAKLQRFWRAQADDPDFRMDKAAGDALVAAYREAVRKRVPTRLTFSPDGKRLAAVSESGEETIMDSRTGKNE